MLIVGAMRLIISINNILSLIAEGVAGAEIAAAALIESHFGHFTPCAPQRQLSSLSQRQIGVRFAATSMTPRGIIAGGVGNVGESAEAAARKDNFMV